MGEAGAPFRHGLQGRVADLIAVVEVEMGEAGAPFHHILDGIVCDRCAAVEVEMSKAGAMFPHGIQPRLCDMGAKGEVEMGEEGAHLHKILYGVIVRVSWQRCFRSGIKFFAREGTNITTAARSKHCVKPHRLSPSIVQLQLRVVFGRRASSQDPYILPAWVAVCDCALPRQYHCHLKPLWNRFVLHKLREDRCGQAVEFTLAFTRTRIQFRSLVPSSVTAAQRHGEVGARRAGGGQRRPHVREVRHAESARTVCAGGSAI